MNFSVGPRRWHVYVRTFRWGIIGHVRTDLTWRHLKVEVFTQRGLRVSTRRQHKKLQRTRRYVNAWRFHCSAWSSHKGNQGRARSFGLLFYRGQRPT